MRPCTLVVVLSVGSPVIAFEIVSLPLNSVYQEFLGKKTLHNHTVLLVGLPVPSHLTALQPVVNFRNLRKKGEYRGYYVFIDFSENRQLDGEDRIKILNLKGKQLQLSPFSVLRGCPINKFVWPSEARDYLESTMACVKSG